LATTARRPGEVRVQKDVKKAVVSVVTTVVGLIVALHLPTGDSLEFYEVEETVYSFDTFSIDLHPPPVEIDLRITGMDLADQLRWLVPGRNHCVEFQNGYLIVRATNANHVLIRACLDGRRLRNRMIQSAAVAAWNAKTTLCEKVFGMITK
jgi:hypothetical protein